jgi:hypothetical protein
LYESITNPNGKIVVLVRMEESGFPGRDRDVQNADILVLKDQVVEGLLVHRYGCGLGGDSRNGNGGNGHGRLLCVFEFDLNIFVRGIEQIFDGVSGRLPPMDVAKSNVGVPLGPVR